MIFSLVVREYKRHITRADYSAKPTLGTENVLFPKVGSLQSRSLARLLKGQTLTHRCFDSASRSYRLSGYIEKLRDKGWPIVNHDERAKTLDVTGRYATFTRYELYANFSPELTEKIKAFCLAVEKFEEK
ncbi:hypothetical protein [Methylotuvimicrobium sp. KM2]|uniref:hypothetical protein n=1 Tax=Methylotuvimicrobium sp. KM2 TaxID=3133976 RepID=UPI0031010C1D